MKLRKLGTAFDNIEQYLASMDCDTFFAQLGTSIEELKHKAANQTYLNSSYDMVYYDNAVSSSNDIVSPKATGSFHIAMNFSSSLPYSNIQSHEASEIYYSNSTETNNVSSNQAYAA